MAESKSNIVKFTPSKESAVAEIRRQLERAFSLVTGARSLLGEVDAEDADRLLDMAQDILAEHEYINRVDPSRNEEVDHD